MKKLSTTTQRTGQRQTREYAGALISHTGTATADRRAREHAQALERGLRLTGRALSEIGVRLLRAASHHQHSKNSGVSNGQQRVQRPARNEDDKASSRVKRQRQQRHRSQTEQRARRDGPDAGGASPRAAICRAITQTTQDIRHERLRLDERGGGKGRGGRVGKMWHGDSLRHRLR